MADFNSTSPDIYHQVNNNETLTHYERRLDSFPNVSEKTWKIIIDTEKNIATILVSSETKQQTETLSEDFKLKFIDKLKKLPDYEGSRLQEVVEKWELEIVKTKPISFTKQKLKLEIKNSKYALYEKWWNVLYFVELNWDKYFHVDRVRKWIAWWTIENWLELFFWWRQVLENWIYNIYIWDRKIDIHSEEYRKILLICWESVIQLKKKLEKLYEQKKGWF